MADPSTQEINRQGGHNQEQRKWQRNKVSYTIVDGTQARFPRKQRKNPRHDRRNEHVTQGNQSRSPTKLRGPRDADQIERIRGSGHSVKSLISVLIGKTLFNEKHRGHREQNTRGVNEEPSARSRL